MRSEQATGRGYSDEPYQVVLRPMLGIESLKKTKEFLAKRV
jgi:hypothetical protein